MDGYICPHFVDILPHPVQCIDRYLSRLNALTEFQPAQDANPGHSLAPLYHSDWRVFEHIQESFPLPLLSDSR
ncbi:hypothetical protein DERF_004679 [Dermatophagoides farinae]|uniref:Uncharacterized protein n=1 Tax=Dermatophagoides farinae TaxID=6954 RepID=A0A922L5T3_DERFA|nr:hypothetical protein DERF_004679 [Dermatophagoides farinae]